MSHSTKLGVYLLSYVLTIWSVRGDGFLKQDVQGSIGFQEAMSSVMGCTSNGASTGMQEYLVAVQSRLAPTWRALPKNGKEEVEWRSLRYLAHRYFLQKSNLLLRGLEPTRHVNESQLGHADVLTRRVPSLVESAFDGKRSANSFSLTDAAILVATMERLMLNDESALLSTVYIRSYVEQDDLLHHGVLVEILESYVVHWLLKGSPSRIASLLHDRALLAKHIPHWNAVSGFLDGMIRSFAFSRQRAPQAGHGHLLINQEYSFDDAHAIVGSITQTFGAFWDSECQKMKAALVALDTAHTGRVSLAQFYGANVDGHWQFGESEAYLQEIGALDETSGWSGNHVIIPNYIHGPSNCIASTENYFICCRNECEDILNEIEDIVGEPIAAPDSILGLVQNFTDFEDQPARLTANLRTQLRRIGDTHGGQVPLHGRLFAQWLHYVFPQDCPYPHKSGTRSYKAPTEFGHGFAATSSDLHAYADQRTAINSEMQGVEEERLMSQWSEDEELLADYSLQLRSPWGPRRLGLFGVIGFAIVLFAGAFASVVEPSKVAGVTGFGFEQRTQLV